LISQIKKPTSRTKCCYDKAKSLFEGTNGNKDGNDAFRANKSWFANLKQRIHIYNIILRAEAVPSEEETMQCCSISTTFCRRGGVKHGKNSVSCFTKKYEVPLIDSKAAEDDPVDSYDPQTGHSSRQ
jgi:hypothetical protein